MKKITKIVALATSIVSAGSVADALYNDGSDYQGAMAVGVVASSTLLSALQTAQGLTDSLGVACTAADSSAGCMPQISSLEMASILSASYDATFPSDFGVATLTEANHIAAQDTFTSSVGWEFGAEGVYVCGQVDTDDTSVTYAGATKVAAAHIGMGCSNGAMAPNVSNFNNNYGDNTGAAQATINTCMNTDAYSLNTLNWGGIGFIGIGDDLPTNTGFLKLDGAAPTISELMAGNYSMFGDVHAADAPTGPGFVAAGTSTPKHRVLGGSLSSLCVGGTASSTSMSQ